MRDLTKPLIVVALALAVPILPLLIAGDWFEAAIVSRVRDAESPRTVFAVIVAILAMDVFLPVPSSGVGTLAGARLGTAAGTAAIWLGMTAGALVGFGLARYGGMPVARRLAGPAEFCRLEPVARRFGAWLLLLTRPIPILAEATVLLLGAMGLNWAGFWWPVATANLVLAVAYAALGEVAVRHGWLSTAVVVALVLPLAIAWLARRRLSRPY
jgi:3-dehydroquinate synthase